MIETKLGALNFQPLRVLSVNFLRIRRGPDVMSSIHLVRTGNSCDEPPQPQARQPQKFRLLVHPHPAEPIELVDVLQCLVLDVVAEAVLE